MMMYNWPTLGSTQPGRRPRRTAEWWGAGMGISWSEMQTCIWHSWCHCHSLSLASVKIQIGFTFLVPAHLGSPGKRAVKQVCACTKGQETSGLCMTLQLAVNSKKEMLAGRLTGKSSRECAPRLSLRASPLTMMEAELIIMFCSSSASTKSEFQIIPRSANYTSTHHYHHRDNSTS